MIPAGTVPEGIGPQRSAGDIRRVGMRSMRDDGLCLVGEGLSRVEEVLWATPV